MSRLTDKGRAGRLGRVALLCCAVGTMVALGGWSWFGSTPEDAVREALEELRTPSAEALQAALDPETQTRLTDVGVDWQDLFRALYGHLTCDNVTATSTGAEEATVELDVTNVDVASAVDSYGNVAAAVAKGEATGQNTIGAKALLDLLEAEDAPTVTVHGTVQLTRVDGEWLLADPTALVHLALGEQ